MGALEAFILGIVQGLTEFLPVSSSGHLEIGKALFGDTSLPEESLMFTVVVHFATACSTLVVFRKDVWLIIKGLFSPTMNDEKKFSLKIIISMLPAAFVGVVFNDLIESFFNGKVLLVGGMLLLTGILLFFADKAKVTEKKVSYLDAVVIGVAQAIAILPGISRSGATIATSVLLGVDRQRAARFSFLMVVPLIFGKIAKDLIDGGMLFTSAQSVNLLVGFIAAFVSGFFACKWMIELVKRSKLVYFSVYCFIVGAIAIAVSVF